MKLVSPMQLLMVLDLAFGYDYSTSWHTLSAGKCDYFINKAPRI